MTAEELLILLCDQAEAHGKQEIETDPFQTISISKNKTCRKCNGSGHLSEFRHRSGGVCYRCMGSGISKS